MSERRENRVNLVKAHTAHIREIEARIEGDRAALSFHYAARLTAVIEALEDGASPAELSAITGNGGF